MNPLRILFISPYLPSLIRVRPFNFIKYLAKRGHQITLLALEPPNEDKSGLEALQGWCRRVITVPLPRKQILLNGLQSLPTRIPFQAAYSRSPEMADCIRQTQQEADFDVAHIEHLRGAELAPALKNIPIVFDSVDCISLLFERTSRDGPTAKSRFLAKLDLGRTRRYEGQLLNRFERVLITSPQDKQALADLAPSSEARDRLVVIPNGVDLDYFTPLDTPRDPATLIFTGKMSYHANEAAAFDLATGILPLVRQKRPDARLMIVGKDPSAELTALGADPNITVTGTVPDLPPYLAQATVAVTPMRYGVGIQNKILEAMAMATPVVTTTHSLGALAVENGTDLLAADTFDGLAGAILQLLDDADLRMRMGQAGRHYVETNHNWAVAAETLETHYRTLM